MYLDFQSTKLVENLVKSIVPLVQGIPSCTSTRDYDNSNTDTCSSTLLELMYITADRTGTLAVVNTLNGVRLQSLSTFIEFLQQLYINDIKRVLLQQ